MQELFTDSLNNYLWNSSIKMNPREMITGGEKQVYDKVTKQWFNKNAVPTAMLKDGLGYGRFVIHPDEGSLPKPYAMGGLLA